MADKQKAQDTRAKANAAEEAAQREIIPEPTLRRYPWYLEYISQLAREGVDTISSRRLAEELCVDPSQIAKDLSYLDIRGKTRIGYEVPVLERVLTQFLGFQQKHRAVVVGAGSLGTALMQDLGLERYGLNIVAGFDTDPAKVGLRVGDVEVFSPDRLAEIVRDMDVKVGIITVPYDSAQGAADACMAAGVRGIWNFTACRIRTTGSVVIQNTSIYSNLAVMYNRLDTAQE